MRNHRSIRGSLRGSMDIMLLYQYACACGQPVISGLPLQHAQGALLLSCELRRLRFSRCRCLSKESLQGVMARSHCKESLQGVIARSHCKESLQGVIARSHCKELQVHGVKLQVQGVKCKLQVQGVKCKLQPLP